MPRPHQQRQTAAARRAVLVEHVEHVPLAVHHRDGLHPVQLLRRRDAVAQAAQPPPGLALLDRTALFGRAVRRVELEVDDAQGNPVAAHGEGRVQVQAQRPRRPLGAADRPEPLAAVAGREVQVRAVLHQEAQRLALHAPQRPFAMGRDDGGRGDRVVVRMLDHPAVPLHRRLAAGRRREERLRRRPRLDLRAPDEALRQAGVAKLRRAEFVLRPGRAVKPVPGRQRAPRLEAGLPVRLQRKDQDALRRLRDAGTDAAAGGLADAAPSGRKEAAAPMLRRDEGLGQDRTDAVGRREVPAHAPRRHAQDPRRKAAHGNRRTDQEARQADHPVEMPLAACVVPAEPGVPRRQDTRRGREQDAAEPAVRRADQVAQLAADVKPGAAGMLGCHQLVEDQPKRRPIDTDKVETLDRARTGRKARGLGNRRLAAGDGPATAGAARRGKGDPARTLKAAKGGEAARDLWPAVKVDKAERVANPPADLGPRGIRLRENPRQPLHALGRGKRTRNRDRDRP